LVVKRHALAYPPDFSGDHSSARCTYLYENISNKRMLQGVQPLEPKPGCMSCGRAQLYLRVNTDTMNLDSFISQVFMIYTSEQDRRPEGFAEPDRTRLDIADESTFDS
jgi:hypothetical protein